ncbi:MAG TPA: hypothetical protein DIW36_07825, partial [Ruminococcaceae bacterium]|nr:hypothetical protein [Oscillospiraceae bacterium]
MKKFISIWLAATLIIMSFAGCSIKAGKYVGTWEAESVEADGTKYSISEYVAMGGDEFNKAKIVIKDTGKAYLSDADSGYVVDWTETEKGIRLGQTECVLIDGRICVEYGESKVYFKRTSKNQTIKEENNENTEKDTESDDSAVAISSSPDKYTWYIKSYKGKNCATIGYTSVGGDRFDTYGESLLEIIFVSADGTYINPESENDLKGYVVTDQNIAPNSELKLTFQKDSDGKEYDNLVESQTYEKIVLSVKKINSIKNDKMSLLKINPSPNKYTRYIEDYRGRNLASCGYTSVGGNIMDTYGEAYIKLVVVSETGEFVDPGNKDVLKGYVVTKQNVAPNTELKLVFEKDSDGK